jgi:hypothetical protein
MSPHACDHCLYKYHATPSYTTPGTPPVEEMGELHKLWIDRTADRQVGVKMVPPTVIPTHTHSALCVYACSLVPHPLMLSALILSTPCCAMPFPHYCLYCCLYCCLVSLLLSSQRSLSKEWPFQSYRDGKVHPRAEHITVPDNEIGATSWCSWSMWSPVCGSGLLHTEATGQVRCAVAWQVHREGTRSPTAEPLRIVQGGLTCVWGAEGAVCEVAMVKVGLPGHAIGAGEDKDRFLESSGACECWVPRLSGTECWMHGCL